MPRFYCSVPLDAHQTIELPPELAHHAVRVLRLKTGAPLILFDGRGGQYPATLAVDGKKSYATLGAHCAAEAELDGDITLAQGIASADKMDWIVEKAVELGARRLVPIAAHRSLLQLSGERLEKRLAHWNRIARSASEQCGRNRVMPVAAPLPLRDCLAQLDFNADGQGLFCHPDAPRTLAGSLRAGVSRLTLFVGPEGGWSDEEQSLATRAGAQPVRFGNRVLRTETAGLALIAAISALRGWQ